MKALIKIHSGGIFRKYDEVDIPCGKNLLKTVHNILSHPRYHLFRETRKCDYINLSNLTIQMLKVRIPIVVELLADEETLVDLEKEWSFDEIISSVKVLGAFVGLSSSPFIPEGVAYLYEKFGLVTKISPKGIKLYFEQLPDLVMKLSLKEEFSYQRLMELILKTYGTPHVEEILVKKLISDVLPLPIADAVIDCFDGILEQRFLFKTIVAYYPYASYENWVVDALLACYTSYGDDVVFPDFPKDRIPPISLEEVVKIARDAYVFRGISRDSSIDHF
jgi:hypothetical protein